MTESRPDIVKQTLEDALAAYDREAERHSKNAADLRGQMQAAMKACAEAYANAQAIRAALEGPKNEVTVIDNPPSAFRRAWQHFNDTRA
ncbi:hypothetical protein ACLE20_15140 [Rhizobium sp. YIM 134829]|uniref:hypothetical protein n=1 Tax=Rhizobium sp. YIM 134829 TaxID=3390453 RepID=UPI0039799CAA